MFETIKGYFKFLTVDLLYHIQYFHNRKKKIKNLLWIFSVVSSPLVSLVGELQLRIASSKYKCTLECVLKPTEEYDETFILATPALFKLDAEKLF